MNSDIIKIKSHYAKYYYISLVQEVTGEYRVIHGRFDKNSEPIFENMSEPIIDYVIASDVFDLRTQELEGN